MDAVSQKVDAIYCDGGSSGHEGGFSEPAVIAVPPVWSLNVDAVTMQWLQFERR